jgi:hypothetical protein
MKIIKLTQGKETRVDDWVYDAVGHLKWYAKQNPSGNWYAARSVYVAYRTQVTVRLHHCVIGYPLNGFDVDHKDGDGLNNQKDNLRIVTRPQNQMNRENNKNNILGVKGIHWVERLKKFRAQIVIEGKKKHLGVFKTLDEAITTYKKAEDTYFGAFKRR